MGLGLQYTIYKSSRNVLGKHTIEGESPVYERQVEVSRIQSSARHEKSRMKERGYLEEKNQSTGLSDLSTPTFKVIW